MIYARITRFAKKFVASLQAHSGNRRLLSLAGKINGSPDLSSRKGFSRQWVSAILCLQECL